MSLSGKNTIDNLHGKIINLMIDLGYISSIDGVCHGYGSHSSRAIRLDDLDYYLIRRKLIEALSETIKTSKADFYKSNAPNLPEDIFAKINIAELPKELRNALLSKINLTTLPAELKKKLKLRKGQKLDADSLTMRRQIDLIKTLTFSQLSESEKFSLYKELNLDFLSTELKSTYPNFIDEKLKEAIKIICAEENNKGIEETIRKMSIREGEEEANLEKLIPNRVYSDLLAYLDSIELRQNTDKFIGASSQLKLRSSRHIEDIIKPINLTSKKEEMMSQKEKENTEGKAGEFITLTLTGVFNNEEILKFITKLRKKFPTATSIFSPPIVIKFSNHEHTYSMGYFPGHYSGKRFFIDEINKDRPENREDSVGLKREIDKGFFKNENNILAFEVTFNSNNLLKIKELFAELSAQHQQAKNINAKLEFTAGGHSWLNFAAEFGDIENLTFLLEQRKNQPSDLGKEFDLLALALNTNQPKSIEKLLEFSPQLNADENYKKYMTTLMVRAIKKHHSEAFEVLLDHYLDHTKKAKNNDIDSLSEQMKSLNLKTDKFLTKLLFKAVNEDDADSVALLINKYKVDPNVTDSEGFTPLQLAIYYNMHYVVDSLLTSSQTKIQDRTDIENDPFHYALENHNLFACAKLLEKGAQPSQDLLNKALFNAIYLGQLHYIKAFISKGANLSWKTEKGNTVLHYLISVKHNKKLKDGLNALAKDPIFLKEQINIKNKFGLTPLMMASRTGNTEAVEMLISHHANVKATGRNQDTALHFAANKEIASLLIEKGANINALNNENQTPLHVACAAKEKDYDLIKFLLSKGADVNAKDDYHNTPLHLACISNDEKLIKLILQRDDVKKKLRNKENHVAGYYVQNKAVCKLIREERKPTVKGMSIYPTAKQNPSTKQDKEERSRFAPKPGADDPFEFDG